jgi:carboxymethylenebutenolidase
MPTSTDVQYTTRDGENFNGRIVTPDGDGPFPGLLVITAIFGDDQEMQELTTAWAEDGFVVSVPDIFWRVLPGPVADFETAIGRMNDFDFDQGMKDVEDLIGDLKGRPECNGKVGMLGFCFGGRYVHVSAARLGIDAGAAFHGTTIGQHLDETSKISCPMSLHFGSEDPAVPMEEVTAIQESYAGMGNAEIVVHDGAAHNFSMPYKPGYDADVAKASRAAALKCFQSM